MSVIIEHQDSNLPPLVTKDGVTVFRSLGFQDSMAQVIMEVMRDASIRTASEAGDGTTTASILGEALVRYTRDFCNRNPHISPQRVVRKMQDLYKTIAEPAIVKMAIRPGLDTDRGREILHGVARISANGDSLLADAVMECFDIIGDEGNVTIVENTGPSRCTVEKIEGYPIPVGFEDSCGPFYQKFVNDPGTQMCVLERPSFILYHGRLTDFNTIYQALGSIANSISDGTEVDGRKLTHNVVVVATGFSETVLANFAAGFPMDGTLNVYPLQAPMSALRTGQFDFLADLAALTGGQIFDPLEKPLQNFQFEDLGVGVRSFEASRFRSSVIGYRDELLVMERVDQIQKQLTEVATSELDRTLLRERVAKLTSGIARLIVTGSSHGEIKERRDRAEDAVCAVRGAIKHGALPGGGIALVSISRVLSGLPAGISCENDVGREVLAPALLAPVLRLYTNAGYTPDEALDLIEKLDHNRVYDILNQEFVDPLETGLLDSVPAVREALKNSLSVATGMGTCGGIIAFGRDDDVDKQEARDTADFLRNSGLNEANERG